MPRQMSNSDDDSTKCLVHNSTCHTTSKCWEIKKLTEQFHDKTVRLPASGRANRK
jgi:hypothetical protein